MKNEIGKMSNFFDLGEDILNAVVILSQIKKIYNIKININDIMNHESIYSLAQFIDGIININYNKLSNIYKPENIKKYNQEEFPMTPLLHGVLFSENELESEPVNLKYNNFLGIKNEI